LSDTVCISREHNFIDSITLIQINIFLYRKISFYPSRESSLSCLQSDAFTLWYKSCQVFLYHSSCINILKNLNDLPRQSNFRSMDPCIFCSVTARCVRLIIMCSNIVMTIRGKLIMTSCFNQSFHITQTY